MTEVGHFLDDLAFSARIYNKREPGRAKNRSRLETINATSRIVSAAAAQRATNRESVVVTDRTTS